MSETPQDVSVGQEPESAEEAEVVEKSEDAGEPKSPEEVESGAEPDTSEAAAEGKEAAGEQPEASESDQDAAEATKSNAQWFAVHTYSGYENKVRESLMNLVKGNVNLKEKIHEVLIPTEDVAEIRDGKKRISAKKLFPGYVIVEMELNDDTRMAVRNTPGVTGFVGPRRTPVPLTKEEVDHIMNRMIETEEKPRPKVVFETGQRVKVIEGPFFNFTGYVSDINEERGRVTVMVDILGRSTPVELDFLQVEKT